MNPAHNSYTGPETQYTFTHHRELDGGGSGAGGGPGAGPSLGAAGAEMSKQAGAPAQQSGPNARPQAPPGLEKFRGEADCGTW